MKNEIQCDLLTRMLVFPLGLAAACYSGVDPAGADIAETSGGVASSSQGGGESGGSGDAAGSGADESTGGEPERTGGAGHDEVRSPLGQLTNREFATSLRLLLGLEPDDVRIAEATARLSAEFDSRGLFNNAFDQRVTQLALSSYIAVTEGFVEEFVDESLPAEAEGLDALVALQQSLGCEAPAGEPLLAAAGRDCLAAFGEARVSDAFRRAANDDDRALIQTVIQDVDAALEEHDVDLESIDANRMQLQAIVASIVLSPEFLLVVEQTGTTGAQTRPLSAPEMATRLSLLLTGALPIGELGEQFGDDLDTVEGRLDQAELLLQTEAVQQHMARLTTQWLGVDDLIEPDARAELLGFVNEWVRQSAPAGEIYTQPVQVTHVDGEVSMQSVGVLGLPAFLEAHTSAPTPAFINRGEFVVERLLCSNLPEDIPKAALDLGELTPVEVFEVHAKDPCAVCHVFMDNYGAAFQQYDVDTLLYDPAPNELGDAFELFPFGDVSGTVSDLPDLGAVLGESDQALGCMAELWFRAALRRDLDKDGRDDGVVESLVADWKESGDTSAASLLRVMLARDEFATFYP